MKSINILEFHNESAYLIQKESGNKLQLIL